MIDPTEAEPGGFDVLGTRAVPVVRAVVEGRAAAPGLVVVVVGLAAAAGGFFAASDTEALGRAAGALAEVTEPVGEVTVERTLDASAVEGFPLTDDVRGFLTPVGAAGAIDARRAGAAGAPAGRVAGVGLATVALGAALVDFFSAVAGAAGLAPTAPPDTVPLTAGAALMLPAPKVPELTI